MKPADDPLADYKSLVQEGYDRIAAKYAEARQKEADVGLGPLTEELNPQARVLDVGCGAGIPIAFTLSQQFEVIGVDISKEMIRLAKKNVPNATFIHADVMSVDLPIAHFDAVVTFYTVFYLPREQYKELFSRIHRWLRPADYLLATLTEENEEPYLEEDYFGISMYWSNYSLLEYEEMFTQIGFEILEVGSTGHGYSATHETPEEHHPLLLAQMGQD